MRYFSTFSGIGGFELGIEQAYERLYNSGNNPRESQAKGELSTEGKSPEGTDSTMSSNSIQSSPMVSCVGYSEIDKYAIQIYEKHFNHKNYGDITKINEKELPDFELLVGGFPCQAFSIAGKRGGFEDTRGTMFFELARILREKQPRLFVFENVKGLLSHDKGRTFHTIIATLDELGYDLQWQVLNSKNHGVPQNRERVFIIGHLRGTPRPEVFPFGGADEEDNERVQGEILVHSTQLRSKDRPSLKYSSGGSGQLSRQDDITYCLDPGNTQAIQQLNQPTHSNDRVYGTDGVSPTLNTMQGGNRQPFVKIDKKGNPKKDQNNAATLTGGAHSGGNHSDMDLLAEGVKIRRLTPTECERLQGFPEIEKYSIMEVCLDHQKSCVNVVTQSRKSQEPVGSVEKTEEKETVKSVEGNTNTNNPPTNKRAQPSVLINCGENGVEIHSQGKCLLDAKGAERQNWCHPLIQLDDFVQLLVGINTIQESVIRRGEVESHQNERCLTAQRNGKMHVKLCGNEITQRVGDVKNDSITLKELLKYTTSDLSGTDISEQKLATLFSFVIRVIIGFIPKEILSQDTFTIELNTKVGYTYGVSDTQRYKTLGNAVTVNVIADIVEKMI